MVEQFERDHHRARTVSVRPASATIVGKQDTWQLTDLILPGKMQTEERGGGQKGRRFNSVRKLQAKKKQQSKTWTRKSNYVER